MVERRISDQILIIQWQPVISRQHSVDTMADAFKEINFKFDDDLSANNNTEVVIHRKQRRPQTATLEEEDFRRDCRRMNTSTPKKNQAEVKLAMNTARSSFFGLDEDSSAISNYDDPQPHPIAIKRRDSQMDTAEILEAVVNGSGSSEEGYTSICDINNNNNKINMNQDKRGSAKEGTESGLGSISAASDEPDAKLSSPEKELLLENQEDDAVSMPRNIIREPQYYPKNAHPSQVQYCIFLVELILACRSANGEYGHGRYLV